MKYWELKKQSFDLIRKSLLVQKWFKEILSIK